MIKKKEWRARDTERYFILRGDAQVRWRNSATVCIETLRDRGVTQGHLVVTSDNALSEDVNNHAADRVRDLCIVLAMFLSFS